MEQALYHMSQTGGLKCKVFIWVVLTYCPTLYLLPTFAGMSFLHRCHSLGIMLSATNPVVCCSNFPCLIYIFVAFLLPPSPIFSCLHHISWNWSFVNSQSCPHDLYLSIWQYGLNSPEAFLKSKVIFCRWNARNTTLNACNSLKPCVSPIKPCW